MSRRASQILLLKLQPIFIDSVKNQLHSDLKYPFPFNRRIARIQKDNLED